MRFRVKTGLFLSSYLPLFLILATKNWFNLYATGLFIFIAFYSCIWFLIIWVVKKETTDSFRIIRVENKTKDALNYLVPYIISFIGFDLNRWQDLAALFILTPIGIKHNPLQIH